MKAVLGWFDSLPLTERLFIRARLWTAPLPELARRAPSGLIADIGCGHGLLSALLVAGRSDRKVVAVDPDPRKIAWARRSLGNLANVELRLGTAADLANECPQTFQAALVADVLYLLPWREWPSFLESCRNLLAPEGVLLLKDAEADGSWKHRKCELQELAMVRLLRRTHGSGGLNFKPRAFTEAALRAAGFHVREVVRLDEGYSTPHVLYVAERNAAPGLGSESRTSSVEAVGPQPTFHPP